MSHLYSGPDWGVPPWGRPPGPHQPVSLPQAGGHWQVGPDHEHAPVRPRFHRPRELSGPTTADHFAHAPEHVAEYRPNEAWRMAGTMLRRSCPMTPPARRHFRTVAGHSPTTPSIPSLLSSLMER